MTYMVSIDLPAIANSFTCDNAQSVLELVKMINAQGQVQILAPDGKTYNRTEFELMISRENERAIAQVKALAEVPRWIRNSNPVLRAQPFPNSRSR